MTWLHHDHQDFESVVYRCITACEGKDWKSARRLFDGFASDYRAHMRLEENVLFPMYEASEGAPEGPTKRLKEDHVQVFRLLDEVSLALDGDNDERLLHSFCLLYQALKGHHEKEEDFFLPMASHALLANKDEVLAALNEDWQADD